MNYFKRLLFVLGIALILSVIPAMQSFAASPFNIGIVQDCKAIQKNKLLNDIQTEVISLTKGEFDVRFPSKFNMVSDCSEKNISKSIKKLLDHPDVDMVLTLGPLGSQILGQYKRFPKPCIAGIILSPELQGIPFSDQKSGEHNFSYVILTPDIKGNIEQFKKLISFKSVALLYDTSLSDFMRTENKFLSKLKKEADIELSFIPVGNDINAVKQKLKKSIDAVFIGPIVQLDNPKLLALISHINENRIPSFSFHDRTMVENGLLAGFDRTDEMKRFSRRIAIFAQQILLKENPKDFKVSFARQENLIINMASAKNLGISPSFSLLTKAELINSETEITPEVAAIATAVASIVETRPESRQAIALSSKLVESSEELNLTAFGLNETSTSLSLPEAIDRALKNNLILKARARETEAVKMDVKEALSRFFPQLGAGLNWTMIDEDHASAISGVAERSWTIAAGVSQLLYSDAAYTDLKTSRHLENIQELSEHQETLDVILETGLAYLNMLKARANAIIQLDNFKLVQSNLVLANNRYIAGSSGPSDVYRLESEAAIAYSDFLDALAKVGKSRLQLNQLLNFDQEDNTTIKDIKVGDNMFVISDPKVGAAIKIDNPRDLRKFRDFVVKKGIGDSPEIKAIDEQILIQDDAYHLARRSYWSPNVSVNGTVRNTFSKSGAGDSLDTSDIPDSLSSILDEPDDTYWAVGLNIAVPFFEGGAKSAAKIKALETGNQLKFLKYNTQNLISENIRSAIYDLTASYPSIELTNTSAEAASKNLELVQDAYSKGAVSIVSFLDAQNAALIANTLAENAVYDFYIDILLIERASGKYSILMNQEEKKQWVLDFQK